MGTMTIQCSTDVDSALEQTWTEPDTRVVLISDNLTIELMGELLMQELILHAVLLLTNSWSLLYCCTFMALHAAAVWQDIKWILPHDLSCYKACSANAQHLGLKKCKAYTVCALATSCVVALFCHPIGSIGAALLVFSIRFLYLNLKIVALWYAGLLGALVGVAYAAVFAARQLEWYNVAILAFLGISYRIQGFERSFRLFSAIVLVALFSGFHQFGSSLLSAAYIFVVTLVTCLASRGISLATMSTAQDHADHAAALLLEEASAEKTAEHNQKKRMRSPKSKGKAKSTVARQKARSRETRRSDQKIDIQKDISERTPFDARSSSERLSELAAARKELITAETNVEELRMTLECAVCLDNFSDTIFLPCNHLCCITCADHILKSSGSCPHCRSTICELQRVIF